MDKVQAIHNFWSSFGLKAYDVSSVPDELSFTNQKNTKKEPYITYELSIGDYGEDTPSFVSIWYYDEGWKNIENKMKEFDEVFNNGGKTISYDGGNIWLKKAQPYRSRITSDNDMIKRYGMNIMIEYH